jgi:hypothetical protein
MREYKFRSSSQAIDTVLIAFVAIIMTYLVAEMSWSQIAIYFGF